MTMDVTGKRLFTQTLTVEVIAEEGILYRGESREVYRIEGESVVESERLSGGEMTLSVTQWMDWHDLAVLRLDIDGADGSEVPDFEDAEGLGGGRPASVSVGDNWSYGGVESRYVGTERITVPAGTFNAMRVESSGLETAFVSWYAPEACDFVRVLNEEGDVRVEFVLQAFTCQNAGRLAAERGPGPFARDQQPPFAFATHDCLDAVASWCSSTLSFSGAGFEQLPLAGAPTMEERTNLRSVICVLDGEPAECHVDVEGQGLHTFNVTAADHAGNVARAGVTLGLDTVAPDVTIDAPRPGTVSAAGQTVPATGASAVVVGPVDVEITATDATSGVAYVRVLVDGGERANLSAEPFAWTWETSGESPGAHELSVEAFDVAGNTKSASVAVQVVPVG